MPNLTIEMVHNRYEDMKKKRKPLESAYKSLDELVNPISRKDDAGDTNNEDVSQRYGRIFASPALQNLKELVAGLSSGIASPARVWYSVRPAGRDSYDTEEGKGHIAYAKAVEEESRNIINRSNIYFALESLLKNLALYGTAVGLLRRDPFTIVRVEVVPNMTYVIAEDERGLVDTLIRTYDVSVRNLKTTFGKIPPTVQKLYDEGKLEQTITVRHAILPNLDAKADDEDLFHEIYYIHSLNNNGSAYGRFPDQRNNRKPNSEGNDADLIITTGEYDYNPILAPRWGVYDTSPYGISPAIEVIGEIRELQQLTDLYTKNIVMIADPPIEVNSNSVGREELDLGAGSLVYTTPYDDRPAISYLRNVDANPEMFRPRMEELKGNIKASFMVDLFRMLTANEDKTMTATEVAQRQSEVATMLNPVLDRMHRELLKPLVDFVISLRDEWSEEWIAQEQHPPVDVKFTSMLALVQQSYKITSLMQFFQLTTQLMQVKPEVADFFDGDETLILIARVLDIEPSVMRSLEDVVKHREEAAKQQQAAQEQQQQVAEAQTASLRADGLAKAAKAASELQGVTS